MLFSNKMWSVKVPISTDAVNKTNIKKIPITIQKLFEGLFKSIYAPIQQIIAAEERNPTKTGIAKWKRIAEKSLKLSALVTIIPIKTEIKASTYSKISALNSSFVVGFIIYVFNNSTEDKDKQFKENREAFFTDIQQIVLPYLISKLADLKISQ